MKVGMWVLGLVAAVIVVGLIWYGVGVREAAAPALPAGVPVQGVPAVPVSGEKFEDKAETAILAAISPYTGSGTATRVFEEGTFTHTVTANVGAPRAGKFYEGWLVMKTAGGPKFFSTGRMEAKHGAYVLTYTASQDYPDHQDVVITEETEALGLDGKPEAHVLEGSFES